MNETERLEQLEQLYIVFVQQVKGLLHDAVKEEFPGHRVLNENGRIVGHLELADYEDQKLRRMGSMLLTKREGFDKWESYHLTPAIALNNEHMDAIRNLLWGLVNDSQIGEPNLNDITKLVDRATVEVTNYIVENF